MRGACTCSRSARSPPVVLRERAALAANGTAHVVVSIDEHGRPVGDVTLSTRGVVEEALDGHLLDAARSETRTALEELAGEELATDEDAAEAARLAVRRAFDRLLGFKPVTTAAVLRVRR